MSTTLDEQEAAAATRSRRSGGREARRAMRSAPLAEDIRPVRAGLEGGSYRPLQQHDLERIHEAVLTALETIGFANAIPSCIEALTRVGAIHGPDGRVRFPRRLVLDTIERAARHFTLHGQDPRHDMLIQGRKVHYGTAGAAVHLIDVEKRDTASRNCRTSTTPRESSTGSTTSIFSNGRWCRATFPIRWRWISTRSTPA